MSADLIAALDEGLAIAGEDIILRRVVGTAPNQVNIDVSCRGVVRVTGSKDKATVWHVIFSPTQINAAQWPGGTIPIPPPFNVDPRFPRENGADKAIIQGKLAQITSSRAFVTGGGEWVRHEIEAVG